MQSKTAAKLIWNFITETLRERATLECAATTLNRWNCGMQLQWQRKKEKQQKTPNKHDNENVK